MTDMLKVAEAKAVDVIVKKGAKSKKQSKIPTKASKIPKDPTVTMKTNKKTKPTKQSKLKNRGRILIELIVLRKICRN